VGCSANGRRIISKFVTFRISATCFSEKLVCIYKTMPLWPGRPNWNNLNPWSSNRLRILIDPPLINKFPIFYVTQSITELFARIRYWFLSWTTRTQFTLTILFFQGLLLYCIDFPSGHVSSDVPTKPLYEFFFSPIYTYSTRICLLMRLP
jgi:hypothetical protein